MDFTIKIYKKLLSELRNANYDFLTFGQYLKDPAERMVILRHDVDRKKYNSLAFARLQHDMGIRGTYYFRIVPESFDEKVIMEIAEMGHEIGYHYEDMDLAGGDADKALELFVEHLKRFRKLAPVETICMHGSPLSKYDNKDLWKKYEYRDLDIIGEPYFDLDLDSFLYLTDTGRRWDGGRVSVRDKVEGKFSHSFRSTGQIISALASGRMPDRIMFTFHPQRWSDHPYHWTYELIWQNTKNIIKKFFYVSKS